MKWLPLLLLALSVGCAPRAARFPGPTRHLMGSPGEQVESAVVPQRAPRVGEGSRLARAGSGLVGRSRMRIGGKTYRYDCSGFINAAHAGAGVDLADRNTTSLYALARQQRVYHTNKRVAVGDTVFFDNTHDRNRNGRLDDERTHVALVEQVDRDGTIHMIHLGSQGVTRIRMNLRYPDTHKLDSGKVVNSFLRARAGSDPRHTVYLAGQLWSGRASYWDMGSGSVSQHQVGSDGEGVELALAPGADGVVGGADDGLLVAVEAGVDERWQSSRTAEFF